MNGIHEVRGSIPLGSTNQDSRDIPKSIDRSGLWRDWILGLLLFLATAAIVIWQNLRLGVLWDLSYVLENSYRISLGDIPYRDFPFPYPPLTFLIQAAIIKLTGRVFWHHIAYCAVMGGLATVLTWRILLNLLRTEVGGSRSLPFILTLPVILLGIYCVYPHPFYDPDCTLAILLGVFLLQRAEREPAASWRSLLAGAALVVPLLIKQNTGLAFLGATGSALLAFAIVEAWRRHSARKYILVLMGTMLTFALAVLLVHFTAGLSNYWHWTIQFAASRRAPARSEMLGIYQDRVLLLWIGLILLGAIAFWSSRRASRGWAVLSAVLVSAPFIWPTIYLLHEHDASERAERFLSLWPVLLIFSLILSFVAIKRRSGVSLVLPFILIATIQGAFMSQQLWGSTYAIWPLFMILLVSTLSAVCSVRSLSSDQPYPVRLDAGLAPQTAGRTSPPSKRLNDQWSWRLLPFTALTV